MQFSTLIILAAAAVGAFAAPAPGGGYAPPPASSSSTTTTTVNQVECAPSQTALCCDSTQSGLINVALPCVNVNLLSSPCQNTATCCSNIDGTTGANDCNTSSGSALNFPIKVLSL